eukprot:329409_1
MKRSPRRTSAGNPPLNAIENEKGNKETFQELGGAAAGQLHVLGITSDIEDEQQINSHQLFDETMHSGDTTEDESDYESITKIPNNNNNTNNTNTKKPLRRRHDSTETQSGDIVLQCDQPIPPQVSKMNLDCNPPSIRRHSNSNTNNNNNNETVALSSTFNIAQVWKIDETGRFAYHIYHVKHALINVNRTPVFSDSSSVFKLQALSTDAPNGGIYAILSKLPQTIHLMNYKRTRTGNELSKSLDHQSFNTIVPVDKPSYIGKQGAKNPRYTSIQNLTNPILKLLISGGVAKSSLYFHRVLIATPPQINGISDDLILKIYEYVLGIKNRGFLCSGKGIGEKKGLGEKAVNAFYYKYKDEQNVIGTFCRGALLESMTIHLKYKFVEAARDKIDWSKLKWAKSTLATIGVYCINHQSFIAGMKNGVTDKHKNCQVFYAHALRKANCCMQLYFVGVPVHINVASDYKIKIEVWPPRSYINPLPKPQKLNITFFDENNIALYLPDITNDIMLNKHGIAEFTLSIP